MSSQALVITVPKVQLTLDDLLAVIRQLDEPARIRVAQVLVETQLDSGLADLIDQLAQSTLPDGIPDIETDAELKAVRLATVQTLNSR